MRIDHVLVAFADLDDGARALTERSGVEVVPGGRHPGWGTRNAIVPLGDAYLELIAIADEEEAATSLLGQWVSRTRSAEGAPLGWALRADDLDAVAGRLGLEVTPGSREMPDGRVLRWRLAGLERAAVEPALPFFIEWGPGVPLPGHSPADHRGDTPRFARIELRGDAPRIAEWLRDCDVPVTVMPGEPALTRVVLAAGARELVFG